jgi:hypothetical protein
VQTATGKKPINEARPPDAASAVIAPAVLDNLAARFRPAGVYLMLLRPDGSVVYHDTGASMFFQRYVLPLVHYPDPSSDGPIERVRQLDSASPVSVWNVLPGVVLAAIPYSDKRQLQGVLLLAAKGPAFRLGEDGVRVCSRLGLDGVWLHQQADELPT